MEERLGTLAPTDRTKEYTYSYSPDEIRITSVSDVVSKVREKIAPFRFRLAARAISKELQLESGSKILELGSGLGLLGRALKEEVDGEVDYAAVELAYKPAKAGEEKGLLGVQADIVKLPFAEDSFDVVVTNDVLEHIPDAEAAAEEIKRVLKPEGKAFVVIADPSEARFDYVQDHIKRTETYSNVEYWEKLFKEKGLKVLSEESEKYRKKDWRRIFNLPFLVKFKDKPGFACAFNPVNRPGTYILQK